MATTTLAPKGARTIHRRWRGLAHSVNWLYMVPALFFFLAYMLYPLLQVVYISFTDYQYLRVGAPVNFVGLKNFGEALADPIVHTGLSRAAIFTAIFLPGVIFIPLFVAILVDRVQNPRLASIYRLILLIPAVIPGPMIFVLWRWMYDFEIGPINTTLVDVLHLFTRRTAPQWIGDSPLSLPGIAFMEWWWGLGYHTMFFLAGLAAIPRELFEAARVDGANEWKMFWHVTLPRLRPVFLILVVLRFGTSMAVIDEFLIMGGFNRSLPTYTWTVYMWHVGFNIGDWRQSYAAAIGWIGAAAMLVVVAALFYIFRNRD
jgi:multiple sugar transport system permease protein